MSTYRFPLRGKIGRGRGKIGVVRREEAPVEINVCNARAGPAAGEHRRLARYASADRGGSSQPSGRSSLLGLVPLRSTDGAISGVACQRCGGQSGDDDAFHFPRALLVIVLALCRRTKYMALAMRAGGAKCRCRSRCPCPIWGRRQRPELDRMPAVTT